MTAKFRVADDEQKFKEMRMRTRFVSKIVLVRRTHAISADGDHGTMNDAHSQLATQGDVCSDDVFHIDNFFICKRTISLLGCNKTRGLARCAPKITARDAGKIYTYADQPNPSHSTSNRCSKKLNIPLETI